jgi:hypothetical protein
MNVNLLPLQNVSTLCKNHTKIIIRTVLRLKMITQSICGSIVLCVVVEIDELVNFAFRNSFLLEHSNYYYYF